MRLKSITLHDFRCFGTLAIDLHPRLTVLVGENGAGKTAILDAIATVLSPVLSYLSSANQRLSGRGIQDGDFRVVRWPQFGGKTRWGMADVTRLQAETCDGVVWDVWRSSTKGKKPAQITGQTELKHYLHSISESFATESPRLTPVIAYYGARRGYIEVPRRLRAARENYAYPAAALIGALDAMSDFREMLAWFDQEEAAELRANKGVSGEAVVPSPTMVAVRAAIEELLGGAYGNPHFNKDHKFVLERKSDGAHLLVDQLSQGYQSMLAMAMDFARRLAIANPQLQYEGVDFQRHFLDMLAHADRLYLESGYMDVVNPFQAALTMGAPAIMLVDEIDLHLHPSWQQRVLGDLMRTFPLTQFIVTTHSPQVLTSVDASCIRLLRQTEEPETGQAATLVETITTQTRGVSSADLLARIMGVDPIPAVLEARMLSDYHALIQQSQHDTDESRELRTRLEAHFGADHPVLRECDRMIRLQGFKQRLPRSLGGGER